MPATPQPENDAHQQLLDQMDIYYLQKPFRSSDWKPSQRRNKNIKQIVSEANRREASVLATQNNSGASTPIPASDGTITPQPNMAQATQSLSTLVLERNLQKSSSKNGATGGAFLGVPGLGPAVTYNNIESAPSLHSGKKHYCDITGLPATYTDPKTKLRYFNQEIFGVVRTLPPGGPDQYLAARSANHWQKRSPELSLSVALQQSASVIEFLALFAYFVNLDEIKLGKFLIQYSRALVEPVAPADKLDYFQRIKAAVDSRIAEEQARQTKQQQVTRQAPRRRLAGQNGSGVRRSSAIRDASGAGIDKGSNPDPSEFEPEFAIGTDESAAPSRISTPKPDKREAETGREDGNMGGTAPEQVTPGKPTGEAAESGLAEPETAEAKTPISLSIQEIPTDVKLKLRKLEKLESKYGELLKAYRTAHARVQLVEPFEASLREHTPLTSISDPGALVEYLNQLNLKGDMVLDELKRVSADRDEYKKKQSQSETDAKTLQEEVDELRAKVIALSSSSEGTSQHDIAPVPVSTDTDASSSLEPRAEKTVISSLSTASRIPSISLFSPKGKEQSTPPKEKTEDFFSYESELPRMEAELKHSQEQVEALSKQVDSLKGDLKVARESTESMVQTLESTTHELHALRDTNDKFEQLKTDLQTKITELENQATTEKSTNSDLQQQVSLLQAQKDEISTLYDSLKTQITSVEATKSNLEKELQAAKDETHLLNEKLGQKDAVAKDLEDSLAMAKAAEREHAKETVDARSSQQRLTTMQGIMDNLRSQLASAETTVADLKRDISAQQVDFAQRPSSKVFAILDEDEKVVERMEGLSSRTDIVGYLAENFGLQKGNHEISEVAINGTTTQSSEVASSGTAKKKNNNKKRKKAKGPQNAAEDAIHDSPVKVSEDLSQEAVETATPQSSSVQQIAELEQEIEQLKSEIEEKGASIDRLSAKLKDEESLREEIETLRDDLLHQGEEHVEARDLLKTAQTERNDLQKSVDKLEQELVEAQKLIKSNNDLQQAHEQLTSQLETLKAESSTMQTDLLATEKLAAGRFKDITDLRELLSRAQPELRNLRKEVEDLKAAKEDLKNKSGELSRLESKHEDLKLEMKGLGKRLSEKDVEVKDLQQKIEQETKARERVERDLTSTQSELRTSESSRKGIAETSEQTSKSLSKSKEEAGNLRSKLRDLEEQLASHSRQMSGLREEVSLKEKLHTSSQSLIQSLRDQTHELSVQSREATSRAESLEEELAEAQRMLSERTREGQTMRMLLNQAETATEGRLREMKERMEAAIEERDRIEDDASVTSRRMMREVDEAKIQAREAQRTLKTLEDEKEELETRNRDWKRRREELEASAETAGKEAEDLRNATKGLREALDESERQIREVEVQKADLRRQIEETNERIDKLNKANKNLTEEIKSLHNRPVGFGLRKCSTRPGADSSSGLESSRTSIDSSTTAGRSPAPTSRTLTSPRMDNPNTGAMSVSQAAVDYVYLKNVLLQFLSQKDKSHQRQLIPVLSMLLHFDPKDEQKWNAAISAR